MHIQPTGLKWLLFIPCIFDGKLQRWVEDGSDGGRKLITKNIM